MARVKTLIIGEESFIGQHLTKRLLESGEDVTTTSRESTSLLNTPHIQLDLSKPDYSFLHENAFTNIILFAGITNPRLCESNPELAHTINVEALRLLLQELQSYSTLKRFIFPSSVTVLQDGQSVVDEDSAVEQNKNIYTKTKYQGKQLLLNASKESHFPSIIFRFPNIYGPGQLWEQFPTFVVQTIVQAIKEKKIEIWNEDTIRDWVYIDDIINLLMQALESTQYGLFQAGSGIGTSTGDIAKKIAKIAGLNYTSLGIGGHGPKHIVTNPAKIQAAFDWKTETVLEKGLEATYNYYKEVLK